MKVASIFIRAEKKKVTLISVGSDLGFKFRLHTQQRAKIHPLLSTEKAAGQAVDRSIGSPTSNLWSDPQFFRVILVICLWGSWL